MLSIAMIVQWSTCGSNGPLSFTRRRPARPEHGSVRCLAAAHPIIPAPTTITSALPDLSASPAGGQRGRSTGPSDAWRRRTQSSPRPPPSRRLSRTSQLHPPAASEAGAQVRQMPGGGAPHHPRAHHHHVVVRAPTARHLSHSRWLAEGPLGRIFSDY